MFINSKKIKNLFRLKKLLREKKIMHSNQKSYCFDTLKQCENLYFNPLPPKYHLCNSCYQKISWYKISKQFFD